MHVSPARHVSDNVFLGSYSVFKLRLKYKQQLRVDWDYDKFINKVRQLVVSWKNVSTDISIVIRRYILEIFT